MDLAGGPAARNVHCIRQVADLLYLLDGELYAARTPLLPGGSVGSHVRHCLDFYDCFLRGLSRRRVDYTARRRSAEVETIREAAAAAAREVERGLSRIAEADLDRTILVRPEDPGPFDPGEGWCRSTVARELHFLMTHTIHHQALIGVVLRAAGFEPVRSFGVAPSTLAYRGAGRTVEA
jgi:uncharacterized damage-inducible protein DinB